MKRTAQELFDMADFIADAYRKGDFDTTLEYILNLSGLDAIFVFDIIEKRHFLTKNQLEKLFFQCKTCLLDDGEDEKLQELLKKS